MLYIEHILFFIDVTYIIDKIADELRLLIYIFFIFLSGKIVFIECVKNYFSNSMSASLFEMVILYFFLLV